MTLTSVKKASRFLGCLFMPSATLRICHERSFIESKACGREAPRIREVDCFAVSRLRFTVRKFPTDDFHAQRCERRRAQERWHCWIGGGQAGATIVMPTYPIEGIL
jgi:hypothetical protein